MGWRAWEPRPARPGSAGTRDGTERRLRSAPPPPSFPSSPARQPLPSSTANGHLPLARRPSSRTLLLAPPPRAPFNPSPARTPASPFGLPPDTLFLPLQPPSSFLPPSPQKKVAHVCRRPSLASLAARPGVSRAAATPRRSSSASHDEPAAPESLHLRLLLERGPGAQRTETLPLREGDGQKQIRVMPALRAASVLPPLSTLISRPSAPRRDAFPDEVRPSLSPVLPLALLGARAACTRASVRPHRALADLGPCLLTFRPRATATTTVRRPAALAGRSRAAQSDTLLPRAPTLPPRCRQRRLAHDSQRPRPHGVVQEQGRAQAQLVRRRVGLGPALARRR